jgi:MFS family permease
MSGLHTFTLIQKQRIILDMEYVLLCSFLLFLIGGCVCAGWSFSMGSAYQFHSWRVFVVVCALPCVCAVVALTFMPESPRFFLEVRSMCVCVCIPPQQIHR